MVRGQQDSRSRPAQFFETEFRLRTGDIIPEIESIPETDQRAWRQIQAVRRARETPARGMQKLLTLRCLR